MPKQAEPVYLDYNATAPIRPEVSERMAEVMAKPLNPSSVHRSGRAAKSLLEQSRRVIADALSCWPGELVFTASGTEANNMALRGLPGRMVAISATEHASIMKTVPEAAQIPVDASGLLSLEALEQWLAAQETSALVSVMLANNETGVIQPISEIATLVHRYGGLLHCDAVQALGKIPVDVNLLGVDMLSLSAHKLGAAAGTGALFISQTLELAPLLRGGGQELSRRAGTENVAGAAGFAKAVELAAGERDHLQALRGWFDAMEAQAQAIYPDQSLILGSETARLPNTTCLRMPGVSAETQLMHFDLSGFAISAGSACSSGRIEASHVARAMLGEQATDEVIRISGGWNTTEQDIAAFTEAWRGFATRHPA